MNKFPKPQHVNNVSIEYFIYLFIYLFIHLFFTNIF